MIWVQWLAVGVNLGGLIWFLIQMRNLRRLNKELLDERIFLLELKDEFMVRERTLFERENSLFKKENPNFLKKLEN